MLILVTGGSGSGKSAYAEARVSEFETECKYYIATMQVYGEEGRQKVQKHQQMRAQRGFTTIERQRDIHLALAEMEEPEKAVVLVECMSNLLANEMFTEDGMIPEEQVTAKVTAEMKQLIAGTKHQVIVSNNVFEDGETYGEGTMAYMRALGRVNRAIAELADEMVESVVGIPVRIK